MSIKSATSNFKKILIFLFVSVFFISCNTSDKQTEKVLSTNEQAIMEQQKAWEESSELVKKITISSKGLIRSFAFGQSLSEVKESVELSEIQPSQGKSFTQYLDDTDLNFVDITYIQRNGKVIDEITLDIFLEDKEVVVQLIKELTDYFDVKFGKSMVSGPKVLWTKNKNTRIQLEDVSTSKDPGIKVIFKKLD